MHSRRIGKFAAPSNSKRHSNTPVRKAERVQAHLPKLTFKAFRIAALAVRA